MKYRKKAGEEAINEEVNKKIIDILNKCALDNPELPIEFIKDILISKNSDRSLAELFEPE